MSKKQFWASQQALQVLQKQLGHKITSKPRAFTGSAYWAATTTEKSNKQHCDVNGCCTWRSCTRRLPCDLNQAWIRAAGTDKLQVLSEWSIWAEYGADRWVVTHPILQTSHTTTNDFYYNTEPCFLQKFLMTMQLWLYNWWTGGWVLVRAGG